MADGGIFADLIPQDDGTDDGALSAAPRPGGDFADLIPKTQPKPAAAPRAAQAPGGAFADLIPKQAEPWNRPGVLDPNNVGPADQKLTDDITALNGPPPPQPKVPLTGEAADIAAGGMPVTAGGTNGADIVAGIQKILGGPQLPDPTKPQDTPWEAFKKTMANAGEGLKKTAGGLITAAAQAAPEPAIAATMGQQELDAMASGGPQVDPNLARNQQYLKPGAEKITDFRTKLSPEAEKQFQAYIKDHSDPKDLGRADGPDYDMRGWWAAAQRGDPRAALVVSKEDGLKHRNDWWKTPLHQSFSVDSQWANADAPRWHGSQLIDSNGAIVHDDAAPAQPQTPIGMMQAARENSPLAKFGKKIAGEAQKHIKANVPNVPGASFTGVADELVSGVVNMAPLMAASVVTKSAAPVLIGFAAQGYGEKYADSIAAGRTPQQADMDASFSAAANALPATLPVHAIMRPGQKFLGKVFTTAFSAGAQNVLTAGMQMGYDKGVLHDGMTWGQAWPALVKAGIIGTITGAVLGAGEHAISKIPGKPAVEVPVDGIVPVSEPVAPAPVVAAKPAVKGKKPTVPDAVANPVAAPQAVHDPVTWAQTGWKLPSGETVALDDPRATSPAPAKSDEIRPIPTESAAPPTGDGTKASPVDVSHPDHIRQATEVVNTEPSDAQKEAGNYQKGHIKVQGIDIAIENPAGSERSGTNPATGEKWSVQMPADYGYIKRTTGADKEQVDVYVGPDPVSKKVFVVDQKDAETGAFDEHKVMLGYQDVPAAKLAYLAAFSDGKGNERIGAIHSMTMDEFKTRMAKGKFDKPLGKDFTTTPGAIAAEHAAEVSAIEAQGTRAADPVVKAAKEALASNIDPETGARPKGAKALREFRAKMQAVVDGTNVSRGTVRQDVAPVSEQAPVGSIPKKGKLLGVKRAIEKDADHAAAIIGRSGGLRNDEGHDLVKGRGLQQMIPGVGPLIRPTGKSVDAIGEVLWNEGFFGQPDKTPRPTENEVLQLLERTRRGADNKPVKVYRPERAAELETDRAGAKAEEDNTQARADITKYAKTYGQDYSPEVVDQIMGHMGEHGIDHETAVNEHMERAALESHGELRQIIGHDQFEDVPFDTAAPEVRPAEDGRAAGEGRGAPEGAASDEGKGAAVRESDARVEPEAERGETGLDQTIVPGTARSARQLAQAREAAGKGKIKPKAQQQDAGGMFEDKSQQTKDMFDQPAPKAKAEPKVQDFEQYAAERGASRQEMGDAGLHRSTNATSKKVWDRKVKAQLAKDGDLVARREELRKEYDAKVEAGEIRPATSQERLEANAKGPEESEVTQAAKRVLEKRKAREDAAALEKPGAIDDFGETLVGARKHYAAAYAEKIKDAVDLDVAKEPLSKTWPEPDYEKLLEAGNDPWTVAFVRAAREEIPTRPQKAWKLGGWVTSVTALRKFSHDLLNGNITKEKLQETLKKPEFGRVSRQIGGRADLYQAVGHAVSLKGIELNAGSYSVFQGQRYSPAKVIWSVEKKAKAAAFSNMPHMIATGDTREAAIEDFKSKVGGLSPQESGPKETKFSLFGRTTSAGRDFYIGKKVGAKVIELKSFSDVKEARKYLTEHHDELVKILERKKFIPNERKENNSPRVGVDHRGGGDVDPQKFSDAFGFRGVQFGNYVEGSRRQADLNEAYDALMDMAGILDIPPKAISLGGQLGLAFGARGKGGLHPAAAHYEPGTIVINLTKMNGAGSLGHEWWHALDNYFSRARGEKGGYVTEGAVERGAGVRQQMIYAFKKVVDTIHSTALRQRSQVLDDRRSSPYWTTGREMSARAFESYVAAKLHDQSKSNDYLANIVSEDYWKAAESLGLEGDGGKTPSYPYPTAAETPAIREAFDHFFKTVETKTEDNGNETMFSMAYHGTPHEFDKFSTDAIGSGEGNQTYGWGLYFAGQKKVADYYRNTLSRRSHGWNVEKAIDSTGISKDAAMTVSNFVHRNMDGDNALTETPETIVKRAGWADSEHRAEIEANAEKLAKAIAEAAGKRPGKTFQVNIKPEDGDFLSLDRTVQDQSPKVREALEKVRQQLEKTDELDTYEENKNADFNEWTGQEIVRQILPRMAVDDILPHDDGQITEALENGEDAKAASLYLKSLGIPGNKYLDHGSRGEAKIRTVQVDGKTKYEVNPGTLAPNKVKTFDTRAEALDHADSLGTHNYVLFDADHVDIQNQFAKRAPAGWDAAGGDHPGANISREGRGQVKAHTRFTPEFDAKRAELTKELRKRLNQIGLTDIALKVPDWIKAVGENQSQEFGSYADGFYSPLKRLIAVAIDSKKGWENAIDHESIHALRDLGLINDKEWAILSKKAGEWAKKYDIEKTYAPIRAEKVIEEAIAHAFPDFVAGKLGNAGGAVNRIFRKISNFFEAARNALDGLGFKSADDIFRDIDSGKIGNRDTPDRMSMRKEPQNDSPDLQGDIGSDRSAVAPDGQTTEELIKKSASKDEILDHIAQHSTDPQRQHLARVLKKTIASNIVFRHMRDSEAFNEESGNYRGGFYDNQRNLFTVHAALAADPERVFLHEAVHAATVHAINSRTPTGKKIDRIFDAYQALSGKYSWRDSGDQYGFRNSKEFIAEALTKPKFRKILDGIKQDGQLEKSLLQRLEDVLRKFFGLKPKDPLKYILENEAEIMDPKTVLGATARETLTTGKGKEKRPYEPRFTQDDAESDVSFSRRRRQEEESRKVAPGIWEKIDAITGKTTEAVYHGIADAVDRISPQSVKDAASSIRMALTPMAAGSPEARAAGKDFANGMREARHITRQQFDFLTKNFMPKNKPDQLEKMWAAADEESVLLQQEQKPGPDQGLNRLTPEQRAVVVAYQAESNAALKEAMDIGLFKGEGLPSYVPRMVVAIGADGKANRLGYDGSGATGLDALGRNLKTTSPNLRQRKHLTTEETEEAAQHLDSNAMVVKDIRTLPLAMGRLREAIAGRRLINQIREIGRSTGETTVSEGEEPQDDHKWFTIDHPAFKIYRPKVARDQNGDVVLEGNKVKMLKDEDGNLIFEKVPLFVRDDFEGPLRAVLSQDMPKVMKAIMTLKGKTMSIIMYSPMMHNMVIWGKAFPTAPLKMLNPLWKDANGEWHVSLELYGRGRQAKKDPVIMKEAIRNGLDPIGHRFGITDATGLVDEPNLKPGRSWTSQAFAYIPEKLWDKETGDKVRRTIDKMGDVWHNKLLWDMVGDLQMGLYTHLRDAAVKHGADDQTAGRYAAHFANRYAGALPIEAMSKSARMWANMLLFSRSFTLTNLGAFKDLTNGLPKDVQAQILRDKGTAALEKIQGTARRKAASLLIMDIALAHVGVALAAYTVAWMAGTAYQSPDENEAGKENRFLIRYDQDGTAIYGRMPVGKVGEDLQDWALSPTTVLKKKLSPMGHAAYGVLTNDKGFGQKIYDPYDASALGYAQNAGRVAGFVVDSMLPIGPFEVLGEMGKKGGKGDARTKLLQLTLPFAGITVSKGAPGGPAMGQLYASKDEHEFQVGEHLPEIKEKIRAGDVQGAVAEMADLGISRSYMRFLIRTTQHPGAKLTRRQLQEFLGYATPGEKEKMKKFIEDDRERKAEKHSDLEPGDLKGALKSGDLTRFAAAGGSWSRQEAIQAAAGAGLSATAAALRDTPGPIRPKPSQNFVGERAAG